MALRLGVVLTAVFSGPSPLVRRPGQAHPGPGRVKQGPPAWGGTTRPADPLLPARPDYWATWIFGIEAGSTFAHWLLDQVLRKS